MDKSDYIEILRERIDNQSHTLSMLRGSHYARPQTALDIWRFVLDIKTLCALTNGDYAEMVDSFAEKANLTMEDIRSYAVVGEWIALDRSTRNLPSDEYDEFWANPDNQPSIFVPPADEQDDSLLELLNEMWKL
jgi:hypothetical protein